MAWALRVHTLAQQALADLSHFPSIFFKSCTLTHYVDEILKTSRGREIIIATGLEGSSSYSENFWDLIYLNSATTTF